MIKLSVLILWMKSTLYVWILAMELLLPRLPNRRLLLRQTLLVKDKWIVASTIAGSISIVPLNVVGLIVAMHSMNPSKLNVWMLVVLLFVWNHKEEELMLTVSVNVMAFVLLLNRLLLNPPLLFRLLLVPLALTMILVVALTFVRRIILRKGNYGMIAWMNAAM